MSSTTGGSAIFPPPEQFAHPSSTQDQTSRSSSGSSSRKRKRDATSASASVATKFSEKSKMLLRSLYQRCWFCEADTKLDNCHVIAQADRFFYAALTRGLLTFETLANAENGIALCGRCHKEYDDTQSPGFIIFPTDLSYFIEFERADYDRRTCAAVQNGGRPVKRAVPSPEEYQEHQCRSGRISEDACGGLYQRVILRNFLSPIEYGSSSRISGQDDAMPPHPVITPAPWHGAPLAPLLRTFLVHGSPVVGMEVVPVEIRDQLRTLQDLYARVDPVTCPRGRVDELQTEVASVVSTTPRAAHDDVHGQIPTQAPTGSGAAALARDGHRATTEATGHAVGYRMNCPTEHQHPDLKSDQTEAHTCKRKRPSPDSQLTASEHDSAIYMKPANASSSVGHLKTLAPQGTKKMRLLQKNYDEERGEEVEEDTSSTASRHSEGERVHGAKSNGALIENRHVQKESKTRLRQHDKNIASRATTVTSQFVWGPDSSSSNKATWFPRMHGLSSAGVADDGVDS